MLAFWFGTLDHQLRFAKRSALDIAMSLGFLDTYEHVAAAASADRSGLLDAPETALAAVIVLDQFPRNIFRGSPRAFATDPLALTLAKGMVAAGHDRRLGKDERLFCYLPFEHSEALVDQQRAVGLIADLGDAELTRYAVAHRDIVARFGRFPHRNSVLGRTSTRDELAFLAGPGSSF